MGNNLLNLKMTLKLNNARIWGVNFQAYSLIHSKFKANNFGLIGLRDKLKRILKSFSFANCSSLKEAFWNFCNTTTNMVPKLLLFFCFKSHFSMLFVFSFNLSWPAIDQVVAIWISRLTFHDIALWCFVG